MTWATALTSSGGALTKIGSGTLTLTNLNTYTGGTTVAVGTFQLGNNTSGYDGSVAGNITNNAALPTTSMAIGPTPASSAATAPWP